VVGALLASGLTFAVVNHLLSKVRIALRQQKANTQVSLPLAIRNACDQAWYDLLPTFINRKVDTLSTAEFHRRLIGYCDEANMAPKLKFLIVRECLARFIKLEDHRLAFAELVARDEESAIARSEYNNSLSGRPANGWFEALRNRILGVQQGLEQ